jgi:hypothetical protein
MMAEKFALASVVWGPIIENCNKCYEPGQKLATEEKLFPKRPNYCCVQYMANTSDKFGIKFWLAVDVESKYSLICFPYLSKDEHRPADRLQGSILFFVLFSHV